MSRRYRDDFDDEDDYGIRRRDTGPLPHSGPGIVSFVGAIVAGIGMFALIVVAGVISANRGGNVRDDDPAIIGVGLGIMLCAFLAFAFLIVGAVGMFQGDRNRLFAVLGAALNALLLVGVAVLMCIGIAMG